MKVALIGASGFVGKAVMNELLQRGHQVTAIVRNPENVKQADDVTVIKANVLDENEVANAVKGTDAIINAFGAGWTNPNIYDDFLKGYKAIQAGAKKAGIKRIIIVGGAG